MPQLPQHKVFSLFDFGVHLRRVTLRQGESIPVSYIHQDDYYIIGLLENGRGRAIIDFKDCLFSKGDVFFIQPGQIHRFIGSKDAEGWLLFVDDSFIGSAERCVFDNFLLFGSSFKIDGQRRDELTQIASILIGRMDYITDEMEKATVRRLAEAFIGIVAEAVSDIGLQQVKFSRRRIELVRSFRNLLAEHLAINRSPSYYAALLNISPVYLNEVVKDVTGMNVTLYIRSEVVLKAKRMLVYTDLAVKEISSRLGIDDYAYFSRLFTRTAGVSPTVFRQINLG